ncbi:hypothetical protein COU19_00845 [Candidatus Kaiserbacteria bacterium CG10_big_fil_rev_8_21_14_0_10_56_12]|uniref:Uncharacterized protein n=1 Tax=Candidatus Kaiserbacteria bacterium CG10_big_fil_rev_8_21_14_0_10_56_12 TaxID=1974611 RepID=A0A2H0UAI5_9BACT|nr:MAG: hypothetical protein COU19_00845 [Candidatus Kaiserbacteria bacterium CG10_big_fil_rev_8_21_14_0_10_56_12]
MSVETKARILIMGLITVIAGLAIWGLRPTPSAQPDLIQPLVQTVARCAADGRNCYGEFVETKKPHVIYRMANFSTLCCGFEIDFRNMAGQAASKSKWLEGVERIVLPSDRPTWDKIAVEYARQYVAQ